MTLGNYSFPLSSFQYGSSLGQDINIDQRSIAMATCLFLALISTKYYLDCRKRNVNVPAEGAATSVIDLYRGAYGFLKNAKGVLLEGYEKYNLGTFKVPTMERWLVVINKPGLIEEVRKAPDDKFSFMEATSELILARWTVGMAVFENPYHLSVVQNQLTRSLNSRLGDIRDEIMCSFNDLIPQRDFWVPIPAFQTMQNIICRTSNRLFVGFPLCRDEEYIDLNISFTISIMSVANRLAKFPDVLKPFIGPFLSSYTRSLEKGMRLLRPVLEERIRMYEEYGDDWPDKPVNLISWIMDEAPENEKRSIEGLTIRVLVINFAAIHTSSNSFTHALYHLAAEPEKYIPPIREEIETIMKEQGWTKASMTKMWKLDSFMKESQRLNGIGLLSMSRKVLKDYTLSDGTFLPAGTFVIANLTGAHRDTTFYENPETFDGFRFARIRESSEAESLKHQMVSTTSEYLAFGHGRHACPGRFFAVNELKAMMIHIILNYDVKLENEGVRPPNIVNGYRLSPNRDARVLFRKRLSKTD